MSVKSDLLSELEACRGEYVSGQSLADAFGVSRAAVWKAVKSLMAEGYQIDSVPHKGYSLAADCDLISPQAILLHLPEEFSGMDIRVFKEVDSTNNEAKRLLAAGGSFPALIVAGAQSSGRGRNGHSFYSPADSGLYLSLVMEPQTSLDRSAAVTTMAAAAVCQAVKELSGLQPQIKWVNDIYLHGKKICGILTEAVTDLESGMVSGIVVGIGVNICTGDFPPELRDIAGSIGCRIDRNRLAAGISGRLLAYWQHPQDRSYLEYCRLHSMVLGQDIVYYEQGQPNYARALDLDDNGGLRVVDREGREKILRSGEISLRIARTADND